MMHGPINLSGKYCSAGQGTGENMKGHMRFTCRIPKATETHPEYVILVACLRQQLLTRMRFCHVYLCIVCLVTDQIEGLGSY